MSGVSMRIDIDRLTEAELIDLNNRVVARLQFLAQMRAHAQAQEPRGSESPAPSIVPLRRK